jgi:hypothetical protein
MDADIIFTPSVQPAFIEVAETSIGVAELFPAVWNAAEGLTSPITRIRSEALDRLLELGAPRLSPLVAYLLATRLIDPDISLRYRVIQILGELLALDEQGRLAPEPVRRHLSGYLAQMRTRNIFALLEVAVSDPRAEPHISRLLNACPFAGNHLAEILADRNITLPIRQQAAYFIGRVGFLDALPTLERLAARLGTRLSGQQSMPFAPPPSGQDESELLPVVQNALRLLRFP